MALPKKKWIYLFLAASLAILFLVPSLLLGTGDFPSTNALNRDRQNPALRGQEVPYVELAEQGVGYVELEFVNPGPHLAFFEYRIDGEDSPYRGTDWENTHPLVDREGSWRYDDPDYDYSYPHFTDPGPGQYYHLIGLDPSGQYQDVRVEQANRRMERFEVRETIEVRLAYAQNPQWCFDWTAFSAQNPAIVAVQNQGGTISPSGEVTAAYGSSKTFTIQADPGYYIQDVIVDGESVGPVDTYDFFRITDSHSIEPVFASLEGNTSEFVNMLYQNILGRETDPQGLTDWVTAIAQEGMTGEEVATALIFSDEGRQRTEAYDNTQFVAFLYRALLDREPDIAGLSGWAAALYEGMSRQRVVQGLCRSPEWENICAGYQITPY